MRLVVSITFIHIPFEQARQSYYRAICCQMIKYVGREEDVKKNAIMVNLVSVLMVILRPYTAGSPMNEGIRWTNLSWTRISELLKAKGLHVGRYVVKNLIGDFGVYPPTFFGKKTFFN